MLLSPSGLSILPGPARAALIRARPGHAAVRALMMSLAVLLGLAWLTSPAQATHDGGARTVVLSFSPDAARVLVARCGVQGEEGELRVQATVSGKRLARLKLEEPTDLPRGTPSPLSLCEEVDVRELQKTLTHPKLDKRIGALIQKHMLTSRPVRTARSPTRDRYMLVTISRQVAEARLYEGRKLTRKKRWTVRSNAEGSAADLRVAWDPSGKVVVVHGALTRTRRVAGGTDYTPVLRMWRPKTRGKRWLDDTVVGGQLFKFAEREFKLCRRGREADSASCETAYEAYSKVVKLDRSHLLAWYMLARSAAGMGKTSTALAALYSLRDHLRDHRLRVYNRALALLNKSRTERDLKDLWKHPKFLALFPK